jgi:hypothetical protein
MLVNKKFLWKYRALKLCPVDPCRRVPLIMIWRDVDNAGVRPEEDPGLLLHQGHHILHRPLTKTSGIQSIQLGLLINVLIFQFIEQEN